MLKSAHRILLSLTLAAASFAAFAEGTRLQYAAATTANVLLDTGVVPNSRGAVEVKFLYLNGSVNGGIWCARGYKDANSWAINTFSAMCHSGGFRFDYNNSNGSANTTALPISTTAPQIARLDAGTGTVDNVTIRSDSPATYTVGGPICLFGTYRWRPDKTGLAKYDSIGTCMIGNIYYCRVYDADGDLTNEFVPFRSSEGIVGMIDIVDNETLDESKFVAPVQGTLTAGPDACPHENIVDGICQDCHKDLYASDISPISVARESTTLTFSATLNGFGAYADSAEAILKLAEADGELQTVDSQILLEPCLVSFAQAIDSNKVYRYEVTITNNAPISRATTRKGYSFPPEPHSSAFLTDLANSENRIPSSPYATGGDIILQDGDDYIHVFCSTNGTASFIPANTLVARVLAVGGGGAGGMVGGGGGAGGMVDFPSAAFTAGNTYTVQVGAGGVWPKEYIDGPGTKVIRGTQVNGVWNGHWYTAYGKRYSGNASSISNIVDSVGCEIVFAMGGGGGGSCNNANGQEGGSGGGAYSNSSAPGFGTAGQGFAGGVGFFPVGSAHGPCSGGGGGASERGKDGTDSSSATKAGSGGNGVASDILGFEQYFAGGGGGGCQPSYATGGDGGLGGGGSKPRGYAADDAESGVDGLGGGGAGSGGQPGNVWGFLPGDGGNGIVAIRYAAPTGPEMPALSLYSATPALNGTVEFSYSVGSCGEGASDATVYLVWGYAGDMLRYTNTLATTVPVGMTADSASFFYPGREYQAALYAENASGQRSLLTKTVDFSMASNAVDPTHDNLEQPLFGPVVVLDRTGGDYVIVTGKLSRAGGSSAFSDCQVILRWGLTNNRSFFDHEITGTVNADGTFSVRPENIESSATHYGEFLVVNPVGDMDRVPVSFTTADTATYRWKAEAWEGEWRDPANWDGAPNDYGLGYPTDSSIADFTSTEYATVYVSGTIRCSKFLKERSGAQYTFIGTTDGAQVIPLTRNQRNDPHAFAGDQYVEFDHMGSVLTTFDIGSYKLTNGDHLILRNGAEVKAQRGTTENFILELSGADSTLELYDGSTVFCGNNGLIVSGSAAEVIAENGSRISTTRLTMSNGTRLQLNSSSMDSQELRLAEKSGTSPATIVLSGVSPSVTGLKSVYALQTNANFRCLIPTNGWPTARITSGSDVKNTRVFGLDGNGNGCPIVFNVPATAKIRTSKDYSTRESQIVAWPNGIDFTKVGFGTVAQPDDYFYFTSTNDQKYVLCSTNSSMVATADLPAIAIEEPPMMTGIWYFHATHPAGTVIFMR